MDAALESRTREVAEALPGEDRAHTAHEAADLLFHLLVGLEAAQVPVDDVFAQLRGYIWSTDGDDFARVMIDSTARFSW